MIILIADHNALSRELIRELLEGSGIVNSLLAVRPGGVDQ
jgi:CheY-like chemotaxis protein